MCFKFAKQCLKLDRMKKFFTRNKNNHAMEVRSSEFYKVEKYQTERFGKSAIPFMIKMLNDNQKETNESFKKLQKLQKSHTIRGVLTISSPIFQDDYPVILRMQ